MAQLKINHMLGQSKLYPEKLVDTPTSIQTQTTSSLQLYLTKFSLSKTERMSSQTFQVHLASADKISKIDSLLTYSKLTLVSVVKSLKTLVPNSNKPSSEIR